MIVSEVSVSGSFRPTPRRPRNREWRRPGSRRPCRRPHHVRNFAQTPDKSACRSMHRTRDGSAARSGPCGSGGRSVAAAGAAVSRSRITAAASGFAAVRGSGPTPAPSNDGDLVEIGCHCHGFKHVSWMLHGARKAARSARAPRSRRAGNGHRTALTRPGKPDYAAVRRGVRPRRLR